MGFPTSLVSFLGFTASHTLAQDQHASQHNSEQAEILALETKLGTTSSTPVSATVLYGTGAGTSEWRTLLTLMSVLWPVGSIYTNASDSTNPGTLLGFGTWTAFGTGRVLVGIDSGQTEFDAIGETGGAKTHTLTSAEMPSHTHTQDSHNHTQDAHSHTLGSHGTSGAGYGHVDSASATSSGTFTSNTTVATNQATTATNQNTGGGGAHNNLQPYIVVYMWKRTA